MGLQSKAPIFNLNRPRYVIRTAGEREFFFPSSFPFWELTSQNKASLLVTLDFIDKPAITHTSWGLRG